METVKIIPLGRLSPKLSHYLRDAQLEAARVWNYCCELHREARRDGARWPNRDDLQRATKGRFKLHSQTVQMITHQLLDNVDTTRKLRREHPEMDMEYPWRAKGYFTLMWPAQAVCIQGSRVILPMGRGRKSIVFKGIDMPDGAGACKIVWNGGYELHVAVERSAECCAPSNEIHACVDLGEIHQCAVATNTGDALVVPGRGIRALQRQRNKALGQILRKRSRCKKGSRRYRKLNFCLDRIGGCIERRVRDLKHKGTRKVIAFCQETGVSKLYIGDPNGVQKKRCGRYHNQRMSQWAFGQDMKYLEHKSLIAGIESFTGTERGTSSRCPRCGHKQKVRGRVWLCRKCGFTGHRDIVGAVNMHPIAFDENVMFPARITYLRPGLTRDRGGMNIHRVAETSRNVVVAWTRATGNQILPGVALESQRANHLPGKPTCRAGSREGLANT